MTTAYLPIMSSNTTPAPFTVTASSNAVDAFKAFNMDVADTWSPSSSSAAEYLEMDLIVSVRINKIRIRCPNSATSPVSITVAGSSSSYPTFTTIQTFSGLSFSSGAYLDLDVTAITDSFRYYRIILTNQNGTPSVIDSISVLRNSSTVNSRILQNPHLIKIFSSVELFKYADSALFYTAIQSNNYAKLLFTRDGIISRPTTGQLFPRGFPVEKATIINMPVAAVNLADYMNGSNGVSVKQIAGINTTPYDFSLNTNCGSSYQATGSFCNQLYSNDQDVMWKFTGTAGATWQVVNPVSSTGVLVLDLGAVTAFNYAHIFQMFDGAGKTTHIQIFKHLSISNTFPIHTDIGWESVAPESVITAGATGYNGNRAGDISIISNPSKISLPSTNSRYLKIHCRNTGIHGGAGWIKLGGFKLFNI